MENEKISNIEFQMQDAENFYCFLLKKINSCATKKNYTEWEGEKFYCGLKCQCKNDSKIKRGNSKECKNGKCQYKGKDEKRCEGKKVKEYLDEVVPNWKLMNPNRLYKHIQNMLENAEEIRRFEIGLTWRRVINFIPLIIVFSTAFGGIFLHFKARDSYNFLLIDSDIKFVLVLISFINVYLCFLLYKMNLESHNWQNNWEHHVDYLQEILGLQMMRTCLRSQGGYLTISRINKFISGFLIWIWSSVVIGLIVSTFIPILSSFIFSDESKLKDISALLYWTLIFESVLTLMLLIFSFYFFIAKKPFFETRKVMSGENFYIRYLEDFDLKNKTDKYLDVEYFIKSALKLILFISLLALFTGGMIFLAISLLTLNPASLAIKLLFTPLFAILFFFIFSVVRKRKNKIHKDAFKIMLKFNILVAYGALFTNIAIGWADEKIFNNAINQFFQNSLYRDGADNIGNTGIEILLSHTLSEFVIFEICMCLIMNIIILIRIRIRNNIYKKSKLKAKAKKQR